MIYFITDGTVESVGRIKIGYTDSPVKRRLSSLQTGNSKELTCLWEHPGDIKLEGKLHRFLSAHHIRGEWFRYNNEVKTLLTTFFRGLMTFGLTANEHWWLGK